MRGCGTELIVSGQWLVISSDALASSDCSLTTSH